MSQFEVNKFDPVPSQELVCSICYCVLNEPRESPCRHVFCKTCIERWLQDHSSCPTCRKRFRPRHLKPVLPLLQNLLHSLTMLCEFKDEGCRAHVTMEQYESHLRNCEYQTVACSNEGCTIKFQLRTREAHEKECQDRIVVCEKGCEQSLKSKDIESHCCIGTLKKCLKAKEEELADTQEKVRAFLARINQFFPQDASKDVASPLANSSVSTINSNVNCRIEIDEEISFNLNQSGSLLERLLQEATASGLLERVGNITANDSLNARDRIVNNNDRDAGRDRERGRNSSERNEGERSFMDRIFGSDDDEDYDPHNDSADSQSFNDSLRSPTTLSSISNTLNNQSDDSDWSSWSVITDGSNSNDDNRSRSGSLSTDDLNSSGFEVNGNSHVNNSSDDDTSSLQSSFRTARSYSSSHDSFPSRSPVGSVRSRSPRYQGYSPPNSHRSSQATGSERSRSPTSPTYWIESSQGSAQNSRLSFQATGSENSRSPTSPTYWIGSPDNRSGSATPTNWSAGSNASPAEWSDGARDIAVEGTHSHSAFSPEPPLYCPDSHQHVPAIEVMALKGDVCLVQVDTDKTSSQLLYQFERSVSDSNNDRDGPSFSNYGKGQWAPFNAESVINVVPSSAKVTKPFSEAVLTCSGERKLTDHVGETSRSATWVGHSDSTSLDYGDDSDENGAKKATALSGVQEKKSASRTSNKILISPTRKSSKNKDDRKKEDLAGTWSAVARSDKGKKAMGKGKGKGKRSQSPDEDSDGEYILINKSRPTMRASDIYSDSDSENAPLVSYLNRMQQSRLDDWISTAKLDECRGKSENVVDTPNIVMLRNDVKKVEETKTLTVGSVEPSTSRQESLYKNSPNNMQENHAQLKLKISLSPQFSNSVTNTSRKRRGSKDGHQSKRSKYTSGGSSEDFAPLTMGLSAVSQQSQETTGTVSFTRTRSGVRVSARLEQPRRQNDNQTTHVAKTQTRNSIISSLRSRGGLDRSEPVSLVNIPDIPLPPSTYELLTMYAEDEESDSTWSPSAEGLQEDSD